MPSSTILNKLIGGSGVVKKIGKEIGYNEFAYIYQDWIIRFLNSELKIRSPTSKRLFRNFSKVIKIALSNHLLHTTSHFAN